jgi:prevent-host-death family protein
MRIAPVADVKARLSAYLRQLEESPVVITRNGRPVAVLIAPADEEDLERLVLAYSPRMQRLLDEARERIQQGGGLEHTDFWDAVRREGDPE